MIYAKQIKKLGKYNTKDNGMEKIVTIFQQYLVDNIYG